MSATRLFVQEPARRPQDVDAGKALILVGDNWNDYSYRTLYTLYYKRHRAIHEAGGVRILRAGQREGVLPLSQSDQPRIFSSPPPMPSRIVGTVSSPNSPLSPIRWSERTPYLEFRFQRKGRFCRGLAPEICLSRLSNLIAKWRFPGKLRRQKTQSPQ